MMVAELAPELRASEGAAAQQQALILKLRLELARQPKAYVEISRDMVAACMRGMRVKAIPVRSSTSYYASTPRISSVLSKTPAVPTREVVVRVETISENPSETVSNPEDIVSVDDMPDCYSIELADGSFLWVVGDSGWGLINAKRKEWLQLKVACRFYLRRALGRQVSLTILEMDSTSARHLFWLLQPDMGVIY